MSNAARAVKIEENAPEWLSQVLLKGYRPYVATSRRLLGSLNTQPFGLPVDLYLLDDAEQGPFHEAYLLSNSLSFSAPELKMPHWVLIDCALMQSAIVGFTKSVGEIPADLLRHYEDDPRVDLSALSRLPVSGQIASPSTEPGNFVGISLFSLGRQVSGDSGLGLYTKALALEVYKMRERGSFRGISQYDNPAIKIHGKFSSSLEIEQVMVPLHPKRDMTFIYKMMIDYNPHALEQAGPEIEPTFWLNARDPVAKRRMELGKKEGRTYRIVPPFMVRRDGEIFVPIVEGE
jgi:hypothetical protein